jgi:hypothetical protein
MFSKRQSLRVIATAVAVTSLLATSCGGSDSEETAPTTTETEIQLTVEAAAEGSVDLSKIENQLDEVLAEVKSLKSYFSENADGSVSFTPATIPEVKKDRTYGFAFPLPSTIEPTYTGIASDEATAEEGTLLASAGGVSVLLLWRTDDEPLTPGESVVGSFEVLQQSTGLAFALAGSGQEGFNVDDQTASYATFAATENDQLIGVALIAGWTCGTSGRSFALTVSGADQTAVTGSFFALAEGFECGKK